jgi:inhibitor of cysteine peptidase
LTKALEKEEIMLLRILFFIAMASMVVPTTGCGSTQSAKIRITKVDEGKTIEVKAGGEIVVELEGNPSTGYTWETKDLDVSLLQQIGETAFKSSNPGLIGSGGTLTLIFKALKAGKATLTLIYHRPWETKVAPQSTFIVTLAVK